MYQNTYEELKPGYVASKDFLGISYQNTYEELKQAMFDDISDIDVSIRIPMRN